MAAEIDPAPVPGELTTAWPPPLRLLLGPDAAGLWNAVLGPLGGTATGLRPTAVTHRPDGDTTVQYAARVSWADGRRTREILAATTGGAIPPGAAVLVAGTAAGPVEVGAWRWPLDPALPGLAWAVRAAPVAERLTALGLPGRNPVVRLRAYRPGRRAVVEVTTPDGRLFLKVVRPTAVGRLVARHELLAGAVPSPPVLAATDDGVVVLPELPGTPVRDLLRRGEAGPPGGEALDAVLDALPPELAALPAPGRRAAGDLRGRAAGHAAVIGAVLPALRPRLAGLTDAIAAAPEGRHEPVPVHGDFYEGQLLATGGAVTGLLDVDTAGRGHRIDDWANLLAHLAVLESVHPGAAAVPRYRAELHAAARRRWPARQLAPRIAAGLLGLATGPFRVQQGGWPGRTAAWVASAEAALAAG